MWSPSSISWIVICSYPLEYTRLNAMSRMSLRFALYSSSLTRRAISSPSINKPFNGLFIKRKYTTGMAGCQALERRSHNCPRLKNSLPYQQVSSRRAAEPGADQWHVLAVMRKRAASEDLPGKPLLRHLAKTARVGKILVWKRLYLLDKLRIHLPLFGEYIMQRPISLLCNHNRVALILGQIPQVGANERVSLHNPHH